MNEALPLARLVTESRLCCYLVEGPTHPVLSTRKNICVFSFERNFRLPPVESSISDLTSIKHNFL